MKTKIKKALETILLTLLALAFLTAALIADLHTKLEEAKAD